MDHDKAVLVAERFPKALAEAGYPGAKAWVERSPDKPGGWTAHSSATRVGVPPEVIYRAWVISDVPGAAHACYQCWRPSLGRDVEVTNRCRCGDCPRPRED